MSIHKSPKLMQRFARWELGFVSVGIFLLLGAWIFSSPVNSAPDEAAHLMRAISAGRGDWTGSPPVTSSGPLTIASVNTREFTLPRELRIQDVAPCFAFHPTMSASCSPFFTPGGPHQSSHVGSYYPALYIPLGLATLVTHNPSSATYAARVVASLLSGLLLIAAFSYSRHNSWTKAAWFCACGPLTFYVCSSASTNGIEVAAAICFVTAGLRLPFLELTKIAWCIWVGSGVLLASSKSLSPIFLAIIFCSVVFISKKTRWWLNALRFRPLPFLAVGIAGSLNLLWTVLYFHSARTSPTVSYVRYFHLALISALSDGANFYDNFGWLDVVTMPEQSWELGAVALFIVLLYGLFHLDRRGKIFLILIIFMFVGMSLLVSVVELSGGFGFQARYTLALIAVLPLLSTAQLPLNASSSWSRLPIVLMILLNGLALYSNAHRYAVGSTGPLNFLFNYSWGPSLGWLLILVLSSLACVVLFISGLTISKPMLPSSTEPTEKLFGLLALTSK